MIEWRDLEQAIRKRLGPVRGQGGYKEALALALADVVSPPSGGTAILYGNKLSGPLDLPNGWHHFPHEVMVDLALMHRGESCSPWRTVAAAECEAWHGHPTKLSGDIDDQNDVGYFWDLWKLIQFPAPLRVFVAVTRGDTEELMNELCEYIQRYARERVFIVNDHVFVVVVSHTKRNEWLHATSMKLTSRRIFSSENSGAVRGV